MVKYEFYQGPCGEVAFIQRDGGKMVQISFIERGSLIKGWPKCLQDS